MGSSSSSILKKRLSDVLENGQVIPNKGPWNNYQELVGLQTKQPKGEGTLKVSFKGRGLVSRRH